MEAAFTLLLHAELLQVKLKPYHYHNIHVLPLQWSPTMLKPEGPYPRQSAAERKMALYDDIISYFDKGKVSISCIVITPFVVVCHYQLWESGIQHCKEIASQLDSVTFDYEKLSEIHVRYHIIHVLVVILFSCVENHFKILF